MKVMKVMVNDSYNGWNQIVMRILGWFDLDCVFNWIGLNCDRYL